MQCTSTVCVSGTLSVPVSVFLLRYGGANTTMPYRRGEYFHIASQLWHTAIKVLPIPPRKRRRRRKGYWRESERKRRKKELLRLSHPENYCGLVWLNKARLHYLTMDYDEAMQFHWTEFHAEKD